MRSFLRHPQSVHRGFTLVELLVVIVIIAALSGVVFSLARNALNSAGSAKTVSNLRQIQTANLAFASDNNGFFLGNCPFGEEANPWTPPWFAYMPFVSMLGVNAAGDGENGEHLPAAWAENFPEVFKCGLNVTVSTTPGEGDRNFTIAMNWTSFSHQEDGTPSGANWWIGGKILQRRIKHPDRLMMFYESCDFGGRYETRLDWENDEGGWNTGMAFRNKGGRCNVVYADGHVGSLTRQDVEKSNSKTRRYFFWDED